MNRKEIEYEVSCGNVFADLGLPDADTLLAKARLAFEITQLIKEKYWTTREAAALVGISEPRMHTIISGCSLEFSVTELENILARLMDHV